MSRFNNLPFEPGSTYFGGDSNLISASVGAQLEGKEYYVNDDSSGLSSGALKKLRVVRHMGATRLNASKGVRFGATANWLGRKVRGYTTATTDFGMGVDDKLATSVAQYDLFYVHVEGPFKGQFGTLGTGATAVAAGDTVNWGASGLLVKAANSTALAHPYGQVQEAITSGVTGNRKAGVWVGGLFSDKQ